ncbi:MAG: MFS transporter [Spirochaetia bacterium]|nr:MFS transporter [Spirochaetia bacterium]
MKDSKKAIWAWSFYDWANSAFATTVMAGFFPVFFKAYWSTGATVQQSTFYLGMANSIASIIVAALAPILGAIADKGGVKKKLLIFFAFLGCIMTGSLWFVRAGYWQLAILFYITGTVGFSGANIFYDALLPGIASEKKVDYASSLGFGLGYIGGGLLFLINVVMYLKPSLFGIADDVTAIRIAFLTVAIWWAVFSLPIILFVKEPAKNKGLPSGKAISSGFKQLGETFRQIRYLKVVGLFLFAYWFYIDGVDTIIRMAVDYGSSLGFPAGSLITALLIVQFVAFPATLLYNLLGKKTGIKRALLLAIAAYSILTILGYFMKTTTHFYILAVSIGLFQGGIQALSRSYYSRLIPEKQAGEFYGFFNMLGKFAAVIGPALMGIVTLVTGSNRLGILSILVLFITGAILLIKVDEQKGREMLDQYNNKVTLE